MIEIDGRTLEGGGQILRMSLCLSALTGKPLRITNIRGNRSGGGGLKNQHLAALNWLAKACGATVKGNVVKSREVEFVPGGNPSQVLALSPLNRDHTINISSVGSVTLVMQAILPFLFFSPLSHAEHTSSFESCSSIHPDSINVTISGGTNVTSSPSVDYFIHVLVPMLEKFGLPPVKVHVGQRGWAAGRVQMGNVRLTVQPVPYNTSILAPNLFKRGPVASITAIAVAHGTLEQEIRDTVATRVRSAFPDVAHVQVNFENSHNKERLYVLLVATTTSGCKLGVDELANRETVGRRDGRGYDAVDATNLITGVVTRLTQEVERGGCVDKNMRDQLVVFMALAKGRSRILVGEPYTELHTDTVWWLVERLLGVERIGGEDFDECVGSGFVVGTGPTSGSETEAGDDAPIEERPPG